MEGQIKSYRVGSKMSGDSSGYNSDSEQKQKQKAQRSKKAQAGQDDQQKSKNGQSKNGPANKKPTNKNNDGKKNQRSKIQDNDRQQSEKKGQSVGQRPPKKQAAEKPTDKTESNYPALSLDDFIPGFFLVFIQIKMIFSVKPKRKGYAKAAAKPSAIKSEN